VRQRVRERHTGQPGAAAERTGADVRQRVRERQTGQPGAAVERIGADVRHAMRDFCMTVLNVARADT